MSKHSFQEKQRSKQKIIYNTEYKYNLNRTTKGNKKNKFKLNSLKMGIIVTYPVGPFLFRAIFIYKTYFCFK